MVKIIIAFILLCFAVACNTTGPAGQVGATGATGPAGISAQPCSVVSTPTGATITCPDGTTSTVTNGVNGTSPTVVQFCQGTTNYPDTFCEIGFCFNGTLYATYSANDGFSSEIPPGSYSSDGVNCSCNFTVSDNCTVSN